MSGEPISERAAKHVAAFNDSVRSGAWADFAGRFAPDATMRFVGIPADPLPDAKQSTAGVLAVALSVGENSVPHVTKLAKEACRAGWI
jgi:hypothetical protein